MLTMLTKNMFMVAIGFRQMLCEENEIFTQRYAKKTSTKKIC